MTTNFEMHEQMLDVKDYDPELGSRVGLGRSMVTHLQIFCGYTFYLSVFRSAEVPGEVYLEAGYGAWQFLNQEYVDNECD